MGVGTGKKDIPMGYPGHTLIAAFISELPVILFMALWASFRFFSVVLRGTDFLFSRIPLYVVTCVREESFAPGTSKSIGIAVMFLGLQFSFFTCLLILSHHVTFPSFPLSHDHIT